MVQPSLVGSCTFSATLAAAADAGFDLASGIQYIRTEHNTHYYAVRLFEPNGSEYREIWTEVSYSGFTAGADAQPQDGGELWSLLYHRAYIIRFAQTDADGVLQTDPKSGFVRIKQGYGNAMSTVGILTGSGSG